MTRSKQQWGGIALAFFGALFTAWSWYTALNYKYFFAKSAVVFPAVLVIGVGLILFPGYKDERKARGEDISRMQGINLITARWWTIAAIALLAGGLNYLLLSKIK